MVSARKLLANRSNALRATGPRSPRGKAAVALNAVKGGLFARALVVPAAGETAEEFESFAAAVVADLQPEGAVEGELAMRVAGVLWRLRRVVRYEAAAMALARTKLPPHPDAVTISDVELCVPLPPGASTALRLAYARARLHRSCRGGGRDRVAAEVLANLSAHAPDKRAPEPHSIGAAVWTAMGRPMEPVTYGAFLGKYELGEPADWTVASVRALVVAAGAEVGREPSDITVAAAGVLGAWAAEADGQRERLLAEERDLTAQLLADRDRAAVVGALADEKLLDRVARAEAHLSRELDRALAQLDRVRGLRDRAATTVVAAVTRTEIGGFVLQSGGGGEPARGRYRRPAVWVRVRDGIERSARKRVQDGGTARDRRPQYPAGRGCGAAHEEREGVRESERWRAG